MTMTVIDVKSDVDVVPTDVPKDDVLQFGNIIVSSKARVCFLHSFRFGR
jgi:hypothetical protein